MKISRVDAQELTLEETGELAQLRALRAKSCAKNWD
jgi:hypothetical protein